MTTGRERAEAFFATASRDEIVGEALGYCDIIDGLAGYVERIEAHAAALRSMVRTLEGLVAQLDDAGQTRSDLVRKASVFLERREPRKAKEIITALAAVPTPKIERPIVGEGALIPPARVTIGAGWLARN
jgi:hypothetical protein